jgi:glycine/D-amino acid oxidase-like deaminating enzyme
VLTNRGKIKAQRVVIATHFPIFNKHGAFFLKMYQHRSYVLALKGAPHVDGMWVDAEKTGISLRRYDDLLLVGGGAHRTGKRGGGFEELEEFAAKYCDGARVMARWAAQDCITLDDLPYIGQYSPRTPHLFVATGFNKWGMTSSMLAADLLCALLQEKSHPCEKLLSPARSVWRPRLLSNAAHSVAGLLTPTVPRCPHLGCALKYNKAEHSWDCSCHGSRFSEEGKLLDGPATDDKKL